MRTPLALTLAGLGLMSILSLHCGGRVDAETLPDCPANLVGSCSVEATCKQTLPDCVGTHEVACQCDGSRWVCPQLGAPQCGNECAGAHQGSLCTTQDLQCDAATQPKCPGPVPYRDTCICDGSHFVCTLTDCANPPPPQPLCPPPSVVSSGGACIGSQSPMSCAGYVQCGDGTTVDIDCSCMGNHWFCESVVDPCMTMADGGAAPPDDN